MFPQTLIRFSLLMIFVVSPCGGTELPFWNKCVAALAYCVGRGYEYSSNQYTRINAELAREGSSPEHQRDAFELIVEPRVPINSSRTQTKPIRVGFGERSHVTYAYGTYPGAEPPLEFRSDASGHSSYEPFRGVPLVAAEKAHSILWPLVIRERSIRADDNRFDFFLQTKDTMIALGKTGEGPEVVAWGIRRESDASSSYVIRVVTKNLEYGKDVIAAGPIPLLSRTFYALKAEQQLLAARMLTEQACRHPDPSVGNIYMVIRRGKGGEVELKPYFVDMDGGLGLLRANIIGVSDKTVAGRADIFRRLQNRVLGYFPPALSNGNLLFRAVELFGDTRENRAIDAILFPR
jgi:hypothetical protein